MRVALVVEKSHLEPALPPLHPPAIPSSSSSLLPPASHDPSHFNLDSAASSSPGDPIAAQFAQLFSIVGRLSSEKDAFKAQVNLELASLKSENQLLRTTVEDQDRVIAELSRAAIPDGHWVWETEKDELERSRGKDGRWLFSLEKYKAKPLRVTAGPPTSLLSLPVEIIKTIFELVEPDNYDLLPLLCVSFRVAEVLASILYRLVDLHYPEQLFLYFESRTSPDTPRTPRVSSLFVPQSLEVELDPREWSDDQLGALQLLVQANGAPFDVDRFRLYLPQFANLFLDTTLLSSIARSSFNPVELDFIALFSSDSAGSRLPSSSLIPLASTSFLPTWTHLKKVQYSGEGSVILLEGDEKKETVFARHWRAGGQRKVRTFVETTRRAHLGAPEDSVGTVEVGLTPYEWLKQYVDGAEAR